MMATPPRRTFWLIEACLGDDRLGHVLHVFEDGDSDWSPDKTRALRFASRHEAERFGREQAIHDFVASEYEADELVSRAAVADPRPIDEQGLGEIEAAEIAEDLAGLRG